MDFLNLGHHNRNLKLIFMENGPQNLSGLEPKLIKLEFIIYLPKLKVNSGLKIGFISNYWAYKGLRPFKLQ